MRIWSTESGKCLFTLTGHSGEVVALQFNHRGDMLASGSMDTTAKLWDVNSGLEIASLNEHCGEIISLSFNHQVRILPKNLFEKKFGRFFRSTQNFGTATLLGY